MEEEAGVGADVAAAPIADQLEMVGRRLLRTVAGLWAPLFDQADLEYPLYHDP